MRFYILTLLVALFSAVAMAAESGYTDYILALREPVDQKKVDKAKSDIEAEGGKVTYEIKTGMKGLIVSLPNDRVKAMADKDYVDFMEQDKSVHIN
ncbi:uncharacterized protein BYT42DRAFT_563064 [Radiomyces spectabilis]|uniref:uncharacterized protein n=1 Tax=Radiomyces spectabilis TaxID=64574 RepID=UPI00221F5AA4|nr:uncharacterized protein BYT42DRAFT_563064 [Radiomyces spectabilis]KAI8384609.1 hypothetical protein BYT42DRAFT_563064 [Radiomyces spectabilis]